ncbi:MAG: DUF5119 domain-containing protein [Bacteroidales bacterium]|nr:DUF5119 domain-containing protein [Candidatus Liminaster caballi]
MSKIRLLALLFIVSLAALSSCERVPFLELVDRDKEIESEFSTDKIVLDLEVLWEYELSYDWQAEWMYDWDEKDDELFGQWDIQEPRVFNIRRYFTGDDPYKPHSSVLKDVVEGTRFQAKYKYGYYDILVWNNVKTIDGVQSLNYDEESTLEYVTAYTNQSTTHTGAPDKHTRSKAPAIKPGYAFYQPEFLFSGHYEDLHVSDDPADYDSLIVETMTWYKFVPLYLTPVTYIYLTQVILHNNRGRIANIDGSGNLTGMARSVNLNTHITSEDDISVNYPMRMKLDKTYIDKVTEETEQVDVIGGRAITFGLTGIDPFQVTRSTTSYQTILDSDIPNFLEVNMQFNNGADSTFVFDVTDQVRERYKGGVITVHLNVDDVEIPSRSGGSGFDATVVDPEEETHEFEM